MTDHSNGVAMRLQLYREEATSGDTLTRGSRELAICRLNPFTLHTETLGFWAECTGKYIVFSLEEMMNSSHDQNHNYYNHYQYQHYHNHYQNQYHYTYVKHVCIYYNHYLYQYHFHSYQNNYQHYYHYHYNKYNHNFHNHDKY